MTASEIRASLHFRRLFEIILFNFILLFYTDNRINIHGIPARLSTGVVYLLFIRLLVPVTNQHTQWYCIKTEQIVFQEHHFTQTHTSHSRPKQKK